MQKANADSTIDAGAEIPVQLKLYASLGVYLPNGAEKNIASLKVVSGTTILDLLDRQNVPRESCHLVLLNGIFQAPGVRGDAVLKANDAVAVWPPVAGG
ncbi:MAG: MoaD/ThiS family protein [Hyphomicrobiaceae bacterium]